VLCFVCGGLLLTGFAQQGDDDQIHNVIRLNGCHGVMFKANITSYKEIGREGRNVQGNGLCMHTN
jgi:hypothetical protein